MATTTFSRKLATININAISSNIKLGLLKDFVWDNDLDIVFLQEVSFENFNFLATHFALVNISVDEKGTAVLIRNNIEFSNVLMHQNGRILSVTINDIHFINVYGHSGSQYRHQRDILFSTEIIPHISNAHSNVILGDFNCILFNDDSNGVVKNICHGLKDLTSSLNLTDIGRSINGKPIYTFFRGDSASRIDRSMDHQNF